MCGCMFVFSSNVYVFQYSDIMNQLLDFAFYMFLFLRRLERFLCSGTFPRILLEHRSSFTCTQMTVQLCWEFTEKVSPQH